MMKCLITGGAGFIGSHLVERLLEAGHQVVVIDNFDPFYDSAIKEQNIRRALDYESYQLYRDDILDIEALDNIFGNHEFDMVLHLAAKAGVRPSIQDPSGYQRVNIEGTLNILEQCRKDGIKKFIFASSSSVYGNNKKVPFSEQDTVDYPISPYAATKKAGELLCYNYHHLFDLNIYALRFFTVYGPRQRPEMAIHKFTRMISRGETIPVYGIGASERDFTYIDDIVDGVMAAIQNVDGFEIINLGESKTISVDELIHILQDVLGEPVIKQLLPMQPGDVVKTFADISKARRLLNYIPLTDIETGIRQFVRWYRNGMTETQVKSKEKRVG